MTAFPPATDGRLIATLANATMPPRVRRTLEHLLKDAHEELARQLPQVLQETELSLARSPPKGDSKAEAANFSSMRSLNNGAPEFVRCFMQEVEAALADLQRARKSQLSDTPETPVLTLSLLDEEVVSDETVLENMASRIESRNSLGLQLMGQRFGVLAGAPAFNGDALPLGPHALCKALASAADSIDLSRYARVQLFRVFEKIVMGAYPAVLDSLNSRMAENGVLPYLHFVPVRVRSTDSGGDADHRAPSTVDGRVSLHEQAPGSQQDGSGNFGGATHASGSTWSGDSTPSSYPTGLQGTPSLAKHDSGDRFAALQDLLKRRRVLLAKLRPASQDDRVREPLQREEVLAALHRMRDAGTKADILSDYRQILLAQARQMHGHGVALSDSDNDAFELLTLFLAQVQRDMRKSSNGEALLMRLRLPLLQLSLRDHRFFVDPTHPARELLDAVTLAGARWLGDDDQDPQWLGLLQRAVATVQQDPESAYDTFVDANRTLQSGLQGLARKAEMTERRQVEAARGREKLALARKRAADEIQRLMQGREIPRFQSILMDQAWADVLSLAYLRGGEQSDGWQQLLETTSRIIDAGTSQAGQPPDSAFLGNIRSALEQVGFHADDANMIALQLTSGQGGENDLASRTELLVQLRARARLGEGGNPLASTNPVPRTPQEQASLDRLQALKEAVWIELQDEQGHALRRRLAWVSTQTRQTLMVNRRGLRVASDDLDALARKLADTQMQVLEADVAPAETAWKSIMSTLQHIAESDSLADSEGGHGN